MSSTEPSSVLEIESVRGTESAGPGPAAVPPDEDLVRRILAGETGLFATLVRRHNQRVYRVARGVLGDDAQAEDLAQEAWVRVFERLAQFEGRAQFSTWLTRIVLHEGWARSRKARRSKPLTEEIANTEGWMGASTDPEMRTLSSEIREYLEKAMDALPEIYRIVLVLRDVEELSTAETADALRLTENAVKVRLHRARAMIRGDLLRRVGPGVREVFSFRGDRCDRMVRAVLTRLGDRLPA
jgi:RNA polymerase sigma-70 factor (ECF subfamily)